MGKVVMYSTVSLDGFVADNEDQPGPLFDWMSSGDVPLDESGEVRVSQASHDYTRRYWDQIGVTVVGRHVFDLTDGWGGTPPGGIDHVVVVSHRPAPKGWHPDAPFHFVDGVEAAMARAQELAGECSGRGSATSGRWTRSSCWRTPTPCPRATGCSTCATGCAADGPAPRRDCWGQGSATSPCVRSLLRTDAHVIRQDEERVRAIVDASLGGDAEDRLRTEVV